MSILLKRKTTNYNSMLKWIYHVTFVNSISKIISCYKYLFLSENRGFPKIIEQSDWFNYQINYITLSAEEMKPFPWKVIHRVEAQLECVL